MDLPDGHEHNRPAVRFAKIAARQDLILVMLLVTTIFMMILPCQLGLWTS